MATRSDSLDPELVLYLQREHELTPDEISHGLNRRSGLFGVSEISPGVHLVLHAANQGNERATLAVVMHYHWARHAIGALAATLRELAAAAKRVAPTCWPHITSVMASHDGSPVCFTIMIVPTTFDN